MKKPVFIPHYNDELCKEIYIEEVGIFCDCCDELIDYKANIGDEEYFCHKCYESGGISRYFKNNLNFNYEEHYHAMNVIKNNYDKLKIKQ